MTIVTEFHQKAEWVHKVINSCNTQGQLDTADNLIKNFLLQLSNSKHSRDRKNVWCRFYNGDLRSHLRSMRLLINSTNR